DGERRLFGRGRHADRALKRAEPLIRPGPGDQIQVEIVAIVGSEAGKRLSVGREDDSLTRHLRSADGGDFLLSADRLKQKTAKSRDGRGVGEAGRWRRRGRDIADNLSVAGRHINVGSPTIRRIAARRGAGRLDRPGGCGGDRYDSEGAALVDLHRAVIEEVSAAGVGSHRTGSDKSVEGLNQRVNAEKG